jgi:hypothetical protein
VSNDATRRLSAPERPDGPVKAAVAAALLPALLALPAVPAAAPGVTSFVLEHGAPALQPLYAHLPNDGSPLRGGNDTVRNGFLNVRPPAEPSVLVGPALGAADCVAPNPLARPAEPTWVLGISPDRIPLPADANYGHFHWNEAWAPFRLDEGLGLRWYAGIAGVGALEPAGSNAPPVSARLDARLVVGHDDPRSASIAIDAELAAGTSDAVALGAAAGGTDTITVDGYTASAFTARLDLLRPDVPAVPGSNVLLLLRLLLDDPTCGLVTGAETAQYAAFAATQPPDHAAVLEAVTLDPVRSLGLDVVASADGGQTRLRVASPWGAGDLEPSFNGVVGSTSINDAQPVEPLATHGDFHPRFSGNLTWSWGRTGPGAAVLDILVANALGSASSETYVNFDVPARGNVTCAFRPPAEATCATTGPGKDAPGPAVLLPPLLVAAAAGLRRRGSRRRRAPLI